MAQILDITNQTILIIFVNLCNGSLNKLSPTGDPFSVFLISFLMCLQDWVMENTWEMQDKPWLFGRDISVLDDTLYHAYISHF